MMDQLKYSNFNYSSDLYLQKITSDLSDLFMDIEIDDILECKFGPPIRCCAFH